MAPALPAESVARGSDVDGSTTHGVSGTTVLIDLGVAT